MSFAEFQSRDRRLVVLIILAEDTDYTINDALLGDLLERFGHRVSRDVIRGDLTWLAEQELVTLAEHAGFTVATLTRRGLDVSRGHALHPGVKRPGP